MKNQSVASSSDRTGAQKLWNLFQFGYFALLLMWFSINIFFLAVRVYGNDLPIVRRQNSISYNDFTMRYEEGKLARFESGAIYEPNAQQKYFAELVTPMAVENGLYFQYPPYAFVAMIPFTFLPLGRAYVAFITLSAILFVLGIVLLNRSMGKSDQLPPVQLVILLLCFAPLTFALLEGQPSIAITGFYLLSVAAFLNGRPFLSGIALALTAIKPQFTAFLALPYLIGKQRKLAIAMVSTIFLELFGSAQVIGWANIINYPSFLAGFELHNKGAAGECMICLRGVLSIFCAKPEASVISTATMLLALAAFFAWLTIGKGKNISWRWRFALTILFALIFSPHAHLGDALLLVVAAILTLPSLKIEAISAAEPLSFRLWCLLIIFYPISSWIFFILSVGYGPAFGSTRALSFAALHSLMFISGILASTNIQKKDLPEPEKLKLSD